MEKIVATNFKGEQEEIIPLLTSDYSKTKARIYEMVKADLEKHSKVLMTPSTERAYNDIMTMLRWL